jgi:hypothetical protein
MAVMTGNTNRARVRREFDGAAFAHLRDHRLQLLLNYWLDLRGGEAIPLRSTIDPAAIAPVLPYIWLCEFLPDEERFRMRLAGEEINKFYGRNISRAYFDEIADDRFRTLMVGRYRRVVEEPSIMHCAGHIYFANESRVVGERLGLPLRADDGRVLQVIGISVYDIPSGQFEFLVKGETMQERFTPIFD